MRMIARFLFVALCGAILQAASCPCPEAEAQKEVAKSARKVFAGIRADYEKLLDEKSGYSPQDIKARKDATAEIDRALGNIAGEKPPQMCVPMRMVR